ncbi:hypothetical protein MMC30_007685 [Trapelia coarctata]|nr:hypothetical protein [Trapelia coarctata]
MTNTAMSRDELMEKLAELLPGFTQEVSESCATMFKNRQEIPHGEEPPSETARPRMMKTFGLYEADIAEARYQFRKICQDLRISGKAGSNVSKGDQARNTLIARNATIQDILFLEGTAEEAEDRREVLDTFCRNTAPRTKRVSTGAAQGQRGANAEMRVNQEDDSLMEVEEKMVETSIREAMKDKEEEESMQVDEMTRKDVVRQATADAANILEILRMIAAQDFQMHE